MLLVRSFVTIKKIHTKFTQNSHKFTQIHTKLQKKAYKNVNSKIIKNMSKKVTIKIKKKSHKIHTKFTQNSHKFTHLKIIF